MERITFDPEQLVSVEAFVQALLDEERTEFLPGEAQQLARALGRPLAEVREELRGWGFEVVLNERTPSVRGFTSNSHNLFQALGCHGGSGWENITGLAGREG